MSESPYQGNMFLFVFLCVNFFPGVSLTLPNHSMTSLGHVTALTRNAFGAEELMQSFDAFRSAWEESNRVRRGVHVTVGAQWGRWGRRAAVRVLLG